MLKCVVLDTNVLLADPQSLLSFPRAEVVVPEIVLGELDKLKTARVDPDLRFRGREVSRLLFEFSEEGSLVDGVELPDGGMLRVAPWDPEAKMPEGLNGRNADDRILATVFQEMAHHDDDCEVTLVTNDLNMLLKAQTLGIPVHRHGTGEDGGSFARRYILRPFQRYKVPIGILAVAIAVFVAVLLIAFYTQGAGGKSQALPPEFKSLLTTQQQNALDALTALQSNPNDAESLLKMANFYYDQQNTLLPTDPASALAYGQQAIRYFTRYLAVSPNDLDARTDFAATLYYTGQTDRAIQEVGTVLAADKNHVNANYNLAVFYALGRHDYAAAIAQLKRVIALTQNDQNQHVAYQQATSLLQQVEKAATQTATQTPNATGGAGK